MEKRALALFLLDAVGIDFALDLFDRIRPVVGQAIIDLVLSETFGQVVLATVEDFRNGHRSIGDADGS